jgi:putative tryptophan/tyrosine transport system substrate-binding protein
MASRSQKAAKPVIGFLSSQSPDAFKDAMAAFHQGLKQAGYVEGDNVVVEHDWARGQQERLKEQTADLVHRRVNLIAAFGGAGTALMAKSATKEIPILFVSGFDPIKVGLTEKLDELRRPSGNLTGVHVTTTELGSKRLEVLRELMPKVGTIGLLVNPKGVVAEIEAKAMGEATRRAGLQLQLAKASTKDEFNEVFETLANAEANALLISADPYFTTHRKQLVALAARQALPTIYPWREYAAAGGLTSYGPSLSNAYRQVGIYAGMILNGSKPSTLPVLQPTSLELVINLKTARKLGIEVPPLLLTRADEVIE